MILDPVRSGRYVAEGNLGAECDLSELSRRPAAKLIMHEVPVFLSTAIV